MQISKFKIFCIQIFLVVIILKSGNCEKNKETHNETNTQLLKKIRKLAKEAGHTNAKSIGRNKNKSNDGICYSRTCLESAIQILEAVNFTADPCKKEGFAEFSCHRRIHRDSENWYQSKYGNMSLFKWTNQKVNQLTSGLLEQPIKRRRTSNRAFRNAQIHYKQCMKYENGIQGTQALWKLSQRFGGWAIFTQKKSGDFVWETFAAFLAQLSSKTFLFDISPVTTDSGLELLLDKGELASSPRMNWADFRKDLVETVTLVQDHWNETGADFDLPESFEIGISKTMEALRTFRSYTTAYHNSSIKTRMMIRELTAFTHHQINWLGFFQKAFNATNIETDEDTYVHVNKKYVEALTKLWHSSGIWEASLLQYELFSKLKESTSLTWPAKNFMELAPTIRKSDWQIICTKKVTLDLPAALNKEYLRKYPYITPVKEDIEHITDNVLAGLKKLLNDSSFLYSNGKEKLRRKFGGVKKYLGYPGWLDNKESFIKYYSKLDNFEESDSEYLGNYIKLSAWKEGIRREAISPWDDNLQYWETYQYLVGLNDVSYVESSNAIVVSAPVAITPIYNLGAPGFLNYAGLDAIVAQEVGLGMSPKGINYDRNGNYRKYGLLGDGYLEMYNEWVDSIRLDYNSSKDHYHGNMEDIAREIPQSFNIRIIDEPINPYVADIIGVQAAYNAYKKYLLDKQDGDIKLPGLDHISEEKLFFISYSNMRCGEMMENEAKSLWLWRIVPGYTSFRCVPSFRCCGQSDLQRLLFANTKAIMKFKKTQLHHFKGP